MTLSALLSLSCSSPSSDEQGPASSSGGQGSIHGSGGSGDGSSNSSGGAGQASGGDGNLPEQTQAPLSGAFLQLTNLQPVSFWEEAVKQMADLGMTTIVIQTEAYLSQAGIRNAVSDDRLSAVFDSAATHGLAVYVGLVLPEYGNGSLSHAQDSDFVDDVIAASNTSISLVQSRFGSKAAFAGWYLPVELWTPDSSGLGHLPRYLDEVSAAAVATRDLPVLISPFISDLASDAASVEDTWKSVLAPTDVTILALQDGVGARSLSSADFTTKVTPFVDAMQRAAQSQGISFWLNLESFHGVGTATTYELFSEQLKLATERSVPAITFEFSNYFLDANGNANALMSAYQQDLP